jgi:SAM-dependent methyltransferase
VTREQMLSEVQSAVDRLLAGRPALRVLEAGCGSATHLRLPPGSRVVGIDVSAKQLDRNARLDERIQGDLQEYELPRRAFDLVLCWEVLEHLPRPRVALDRLAGAVAEGGVLVVAVPNLLSVKGLVTKLTPHWFHVAFYRHVYGVEGAGRDDQAPYPTYLRWAIAAPALARFAADHGLTVELLASHDVAPYLRSRHRAASRLYDAVRAGARVLSLGALRDSDLAIVFRRRRA